jgi:hypothetical protein
MHWVGHGGSCSARATQQRDAPDEVRDGWAARPSQVISVLCGSRTDDGPQGWNRRDWRVA